MAAIDEARNLALAVRRIRGETGQDAARTGTFALFVIGERIEKLNQVATAAQLNWSDFNARPLTNGQKRQILGSVGFADVTADFGAQLQASRAALTAVEQEYLDLMAAHAPNGDRAWNITTHSFDRPTVTKAQRSALDTALLALQAALPALTA